MSQKHGPQGTGYQVSAPASSSKPKPPTPPESRSGYDVKAFAKATGRSHTKRSDRTK